MLLQGDLPAFGRVSLWQGFKNISGVLLPYGALTPEALKIETYVRGTVSGLQIRGKELSISD